MKISSKIFTFVIVSHFALFSQSFEKKVLIDIPGDNYDFDLLANEASPGAESFITWINKNDSIYTVFLRKISPDINEDNIVISSNYNVKSKPKITKNRFAQGIKIVWQNDSDNYFQILSCDFINNSLSAEIVIQDSLTNDPLISLSTNRLAWINDNKLFVKEFYPSISNPILVDSSNCSSPDIIKNDLTKSTQILYERIEEGNSKIFLAKYNEYSNPKWTLNLISDGNNKNANFGIDGGVSFETIENNISKIKYTAYGTEQFCITGNTECDYKNPNVFSYPVPTNSENNKTPFFVVFDTDSLENNSEIFIKTFYFGIYDSLINISNMQGNDHKPKAVYLVNNDTVYVAIIWLHQNNSKTDIWIAKELFNPIYTSVKNEDIITKSFYLFQNYPNPFNPATTIKYSFTSTSQSEKFVVLKVYDLLGKEIQELVSDYQSPGTYEVIFDASGIASGVYFYQLLIENNYITRKLIVLE